MKDYTTQPVNSGGRPVSNREFELPKTLLAQLAIQVAAQSMHNAPRTTIGGVGGTILGGAVDGQRGAIVGALLGAALGASLDDAGRAA